MQMGCLRRWPFICLQGHHYWRQLAVFSEPYSMTAGAASSNPQAYLAGVGNHGVLCRRPQLHGQC